MFRAFDNEGELEHNLFSCWWHDIKHGLALLGHVAPYAYLHDIATMYIASSYCDRDGIAKCASSPYTDNAVRFCDCKVVHDGFEYSRQDKVQNVIDFCTEKDDIIPLHVCWESQKGTNCCSCEKCFRTAIGLIAVNADPKDYGFDDIGKTIKYSFGLCECFKNNPVHAIHFWKDIQTAISANQSYIKNTKYWKSVKWLLEVEFFEQEVRIPQKYRIRCRLRSLWSNSKRKIRRVLSKIKRMIIR